MIYRALLSHTKTDNYASHTKPVCQRIHAASCISDRHIRHLSPGKGDRLQQAHAPCLVAPVSPTYPIFDQRGRATSAITRTMLAGPATACTFGCHLSNAL